jgi:hypothetical protein
MKMDIFADDAERLQGLIEAMDKENPFTPACIDDQKTSAVIALCTRLENVLRVVDGQDIATPFDGRMRHREMAAALTKLDEVRLWVLEHLRVRKMLADDEKYAAQVQEAQQAAERHANSAAGMSPERAAFLISAAEREAEQRKINDHFQRLDAHTVGELNTVNGWTTEEIETAKKGLLHNKGQMPTRTPPDGFKWHVSKDYDALNDVLRYRHTLIEKL